jgi:hypothetical protein
MRSVFVASIVLVLFLGLAVGTTTNVAATPCGAGRASSGYGPAPSGCGCGGGSGPAAPLTACGGGDPGNGSHASGNGYHGDSYNGTDPIMGPVGTSVHISTMLSPTDTSCTVTSSTSGLVTASSCSMSSGNVKAGFVVGNVPAGTYLIQVSGNQYGDYTTLLFTVQS